MTDLFNKIVVPSSQVGELLAYLTDNIPSLAILALTDDGRRLPEDAADAFPEDLLHILAASAKQQIGPSQPQLSPDNHHIAFPIPSLQTTLFCAVGHDDFHPKGLVYLLRLVVQSYFDRKEVETLNKKITIQKNQFNRKFQVMDVKHQEMLEETQHS